MTNKKSEKNVNVIEYVPKDVRLEILIILEGKLYIRIVLLLNFLCEDKKRRAD